MVYFILKFVILKFLWYIYIFFNFLQFLVKLIFYVITATAIAVVNFSTTALRSQPRFFKIPEVKQEPQPWFSENPQPIHHYLKLLEIKQSKRYSISALLSLTSPIRKTERCIPLSLINYANCELSIRILEKFPAARTMQDIVHCLHCSLIKSILYIILYINIYT